MYLVSGSSSGIWLNTQQVRGLASLAWSCSRSSSGDDEEGGDNEGGGDKDSGVNEGVKCSEKEHWEDIVAKVEYSDSKERGKNVRESEKELPYIKSVLN